MALADDISSDDQPLGEAIDILRTLVGFDTTSYKSNIPCIAWIEDYLAQHGVESQRVETADGEKSSLFATIGAQAAPDRGKPVGIGLSGHTDVVPVVGQAWDSEPFTLTRHGDRLYGRGSCDMKGFLACVLAMVPEFRAAKLKAPIHLMFSYDEEIGCVGVRPMIRELGRSLPMPRFTVVGEPTNMRIVDAHKGVSRFNVEVQGKEAHSSLPHLGVNAISVAAKLITKLEAIQAEVVARQNDPRFTPPYSTIHVGTIKGGEAQNIVPRRAHFTFEVRNIPGLEVDEVVSSLRAFAEVECLPAMKQVSADCDIVIEPGTVIPAFKTSNETDIVPMTLSLAQQNELFAVSYGTEAGLFENGGSISVVCGPGDIAQAHAPNEFIEISELGKCLSFLDRLTRWCESDAALA